MNESTGIIRLERAEIQDGNGTSDDSRNPFTMGQITGMDFIQADCRFQVALPVSTNINFRRLVNAIDPTTSLKKRVMEAGHISDEMG